MKKQFLLFAGSLLATVGSLNAQTSFLSEDFEGGSMPAGWSANPATGGWTVPGVPSSNFAPPTVSGMIASVNDDAVQSAANPDTRIMTPVMNLSSATMVYLTYDSYFGGYTYQSQTESADLMVSTDGGMTWTTVGPIPTAADWQNNAMNLTSQLAGQANAMIAFRYNDGGGWLYGFGLDNVEVFEPAANSAALTAITPAPGSAASYALASTNVMLGGTIQNLGASPLTSVTVKYNAGSGVQTYNISSINVAPFSSYTFTHSTPYNVPSAGNHTVSMWIEYTNDADHSDDSLSTVIGGASFMPNHAVTIEEATGTWCGWCPRGTVYMDSIAAAYGSNVNVIAVHNGDPMTNATYDAGVGTVIAGYPSTLVNRDLISDPMDAFTDYNNSIGDFGFANIMPTVSYNDATRSATVSVSANFAVDLSGDYRFIVVFTEDDVTGSSSSYNQTNYYAGGANGPMGGFENLPGTVPAAQMHYNFVARNIQGTFNGQTGSLPATIAAGSTQTYTFPAYTIPAGYNVDHMKVIVMLIDHNGSSASEYHIMNSARSPIWGGAVNVTEQPSTVSLVNAYPNPTDLNLNVNLNLAQTEQVTIDMYSTTGELVSTQTQGQLAAGNHTVVLNTANLAAGMYFMTVRAGESTVTTRVSVAH
jgi:hypothetical protein